MGRKSRHKLERRLGQAQSTPKQVERATLKAQRRARNVPPTVEAYERVAASGPTRLIETLIGRHSTRIDNLDAVAQLSMDHCLGHLMSVCQLDAIFIRQGHQLNQHSPPHDSPWPTHLSWSFESTIAALRLMLAGQIVGAAIILRQQLGRWTLLLARADSVVRRRREPIESFIARAWTQRAMDMLGLYTFDVALDDIFDDLDDHPRTTGAIDTDHEHVHIDGRALCPAHVYHTLCELIDAQHADQRVECQVVHDLDAEPSPTDTNGPAQILLDTLALCMIQMRLATVTTYVFTTDPDTMRGIPLVSPLPERRPVQHPSQIPLPLSKPVATRLPPALVPLVDREFATFGALADLVAALHRLPHCACRQIHRSALDTPATRRTHLRRASVLKAPGYRERPRPRPQNLRRAPQDPPTPHPRIPPRFDRGVRRVVRALEPIPTADRRRRHTDLLDAALRILALDRRRRPCHGHTAMHTAPSSSIAHLARPPRRRPSIAVQVLRPPRAAGSPWLAGRNSARLIARYSSSPTPTEKAASTPQQSSTITATTPKTRYPNG